jgi:hypothetical protein
MHILLEFELPQIRLRSVHVPVVGLKRFVGSKGPKLDEHVAAAAHRTQVSGAAFGFLRFQGYPRADQTGLHGQSGQSNVVAELVAYGVRTQVPSKYADARGLGADQILKTRPQAHHGAKGPDTGERSVIGTHGRAGYTTGGMHSLVQPAGAEELLKVGGHASCRLPPEGRQEVELRRVADRDRPIQLAAPSLDVTPCVAHPPSLLDLASDLTLAADQTVNGGAFGAA